MLELFLFFLLAIFSDLLASVLRLSTQGMDMIMLMLGLVLLVHLYFLNAPYVPT